MRKIYLIILICNILPNWLQAQNNGILPQPVSPSTAELMKYVNYPANHTTGLVDIQIPLYTIQEGDITLPITLSYHASGFKLHTVDNNVGMGWSIHTVPSISRKVNGKKDDKDKGYLWSGIPKYKGGSIGDSGVLEGSFDHGPDAFYYRLLRGCLNFVQQ